MLFCAVREGVAAAACCAGCGVGSVWPPSRVRPKSQKDFVRERVRPVALRVV